MKLDPELYFPLIEHIFVFCRRQSTLDYSVSIMAYSVVISVNAQVNLLANGITNQMKCSDPYLLSYCLMTKNFMLAGTLVIF